MQDALASSEPDWRTPLAADVADLSPRWIAERHISIEAPPINIQTPWEREAAAYTVCAMSVSHGRPGDSSLYVDLIDRADTSNRIIRYDCPRIPSAWQGMTQAAVLASNESAEWGDWQTDALFLFGESSLLQGGTDRAIDSVCSIARENGMPDGATFTVRAMGVIARDRIKAERICTTE